jgi:hypothetical protein
VTAAELAGWAAAWGLTGLTVLLWLVIVLVVVGLLAAACALIIKWLMSVNG